MKPTALALSSALGLCCGSAHAHILSTGVGPFYDGFTHLFVTPADLLIVIALSMIGGLGHAARARIILLMTLTGWAVGIFSGALFLPMEWRPGFVFNLLVIALGLLAASDARAVPDRVWGGAALVIGLVLGSSAGSGLQPLSYPVQIAAGMSAGVGVAASLLTAAASSRPDNWQRIAIRVVGSWVAAVGILTFAWEFRAMR